jgi:patatin-like phospholipase/acyl hydrolase
LKGLFSAAALAALEEDLGVSVADHFDLIAGTSTGGLVALGLGAGLRPHEIVAFYLEKGPHIFGAGRGRLGRLGHARHRPDRLRQALEEIFGDRLLGDSTKRLVIPSFSIDAQDVYVMKTPHHPRLNRDWRERMVDVAMATTAAPTFLPAFRLRHNRLVDGGTWANNPALVGVVEAVSMLGASLADIHVLSMGTTDEVTHLGARLDDGGLWQWGVHGTPMLLRAQTLGTYHAAEHLVGPDHILRVNTAVPKRLFGLDRVDAGDIRALAEDVSRRVSPGVAVFTAHKAGPYHPSQKKEPVDG